MIAAFNRLILQGKRREDQIIRLRQLLDDIQQSKSKTDLTYVGLMETFKDVLKNYLPQQFWDEWWTGLPMDNVVSDQYLPVEFTEIWMPLEKSKEIMQMLLAHYKPAASKPQALSRARSTGPVPVISG